MEDKQMKRVFMVSIIALMVILTACGAKGGDDPANATGEFFVAVKAGDYETARQYMTDDANSMYEDSDLDTYREFFATDDGFTSPEPDSVEINGDEAIERISNVGGIYSEMAIVNLTKQNGSWFVESVSME
jgi:hypothetical protein